MVIATKIVDRFSTVLRNYTGTQANRWNPPPRPINGESVGTRLLVDAEKLVVGVSHSMLATLLSSTFSYIAGLLVIRLLGPHDFGLYQLVLLFPSLFASLLNFGIETTMIRFIPKYLNSAPDLAAITARRLFFVRMAIALVASLGMFLLSPWISSVLGQPVTVGLQIASMFLLVNMLFVFFQSLFQAYFLMRERAIILSLFSVSYLPLVILLIRLGLEYLAPISAMTISAALAMLTGFWFVRKKHINIISLNFGKRLGLEKEIRFAAPAYGAGLLQALYPWIGAILIQFSGLSVVFVGYFMGVYGIISVGFLAAFTLTVVIVPYVSELDSAGDRATLAFFVAKIIKLLTILGLPVAIGTLILSRSILTIFLPDYLEAAGLMQILSLLLLLMPLFVVCNAMLLGIGEPKLVVYAQAISCCIAFAAGWTLGHYFGIRGIGIGYVASMLGGLSYSLVSIIKSTKSTPEIPSLARSMIATAIMGFLVYLLVRGATPSLMGLTSTILAGTGVYFGLAILLRAFHEEDFLIFRITINIIRSKTI